MIPAPREKGMILVNVLLVVALAGGVVALMLSAQDIGLQRALRLREASRADAIVSGGELSAIAALRRDVATGPARDATTEAWAHISDRETPIEGGRFGLVIADAQARFNVNLLVRRDVASREILTKIVTTLGLPPETAIRVAAAVELLGPIATLGQLTSAGIDRSTIARLATLATALPGATKINVNTADERLLSILLGNPVAGRIVAAQRTHKGYATADDFALAHALLPPGTGFTSDLYWVRTRVTIDDTSRELVSLLRRSRAGGAAIVTPIGRWSGTAAPPEAPPLER